MDTEEIRQRGRAFRSAIIAGRQTLRGLLAHLAGWIQADAVTVAEANAIADATDLYAWVWLKDGFPLAVLPTTYAVEAFARVNGITLEPQGIGYFWSVPEGKKSERRHQFRLCPFPTQATENVLT